MIIKIILLIVLSCLSSVAYRAGGASQDSKEIIPIPKWLRKSWVRDQGCAILLSTMCAVWFGFNVYVFLGVWCLAQFALRTYWDKI